MSDPVLEMRLVRKGAEANLYRGEWHGREVVVKERIRKSYRVELLDEQLRRERTIREAQMIHRAKRAGVMTPVVYFVDRDRCRLYLEYVDGVRVKEALGELAERPRARICRFMGQMVGRLHKNEIVHGDLTTSNMILVDGSKICLIDFGLSFLSVDLEDRGVDIHLVHRALSSTHYAYVKPCFESVVGGYRREVGERLCAGVLARARQIERRGRYFEER